MQICPIRHASIVDDEARELEALVAHFGHRVAYFARRVRRRYGLDPQCHDDLVSAGYWGLLQALRNRRAGAHRHELSAYVSKRVEGAVLDEARRILSRVASHVDADLDELESGPVGPSASLDRAWSGGANEGDPERRADQLGRWRTIVRSIDQLRDEHRDLLLAYAEGRSISEIARRTGDSPARLQGQMDRIARQLRARSPELRRLLRHEI